MSLTPAGIAASNVYIGSTAASAVYLGGTQVWAAQTAMPLFDAIGSGGSWEQGGEGTQPTLWTHPVADNAQMLCWTVVYGLDDAVTSIDCGGESMTFVGEIYVDNDLPDDTYLQLWELADAPSGDQTVTLDFIAYGGGNTGAFGMNANTISYTGVTTVGPLQSVYGDSTTLSQTVAAAPGQLVAQAFGSWADLSDYSQTLRDSMPYGPLQAACPLMAGDAPGASSVAFTATSDVIYEPVWAGGAVVLS